VPLLTTVRPPGDTVDQVDPLARRLHLHDVLAGLAAVPAPSGDDVDALMPRFPRPRVTAQDRVRPDRWLRVPASHDLADVDRQAGGHGLEVFAPSDVAVREGRTFTVSVGVGGVALGCSDAARREAAHARAEESARKAASILSGEIRDDGTLPSFPSTGRVVTEWSRKSRARMVRTFANLDYAPLDRKGCVPGMVTLTYPGDWLAVAPSGRVVKRHLRAFGERWFRAFGWRLVGLWKLEFQRRGAPHFHLYVPVPALAPDPAGGLGMVTFEAWLSSTWADVVGAVGEERVRHLAAGTGVDFGAASRFTDHRRLGIYFLKHSTKTEDGKGYQHDVPEAWQTQDTAPGRFWGFWGLDSTVRTVEVDRGQWVRLRRLARRALAARARTVAYVRAYRKAEASGASPAACARAGVAAGKGRAPRTLGAGGSLTGGFVLVPDGVAFGYLLARDLAGCG
jgi:hypothetical protein